MAISSVSSSLFDSPGDSQPCLLCIRVCCYLWILDRCKFHFAIGNEVKKQGLEISEFSVNLKLKFLLFIPFDSFCFKLSNELWKTKIRRLTIKLWPNNQEMPGNLKNSLFWP